MGLVSFDLGFGGITVPAGGHIAYPYNDDAHKQNLLLDFVSTGLQKNERCLLVTPEHPSEFWHDGLAVRGIDTQNLPEGQFLRWPAPSTSRLDPDVVSKLIDLSLGGKWEKARICLSPTYLLHYREIIPQVIQADSRADNSLTNRPVAVLCAFDSSELHPELLNLCLKCHPLITDGTSLTENSLHTEPSKLNDEITEKLEVLLSQGVIGNRFVLLDFFRDIPVVRCIGDLDIVSVPEAEGIINRLIEFGNRRMIIDLSGVTFMDATSIKMIAKTAFTLDGMNGKLVIHDPSYPVRRIFELVGLHERIPMRRSIIEASTEF